MIRLFFVSLIFIFFSLKVIADPFTREIGIIKEINIKLIKKILIIFSSSF